MANNHTAHVFNTLQQLLDHCVGSEEQYKELGIYTGSGIYERNIKRWTKRWNKHVEKHGNVPYIMKCSICSGKEFKNAVKYGDYKISTREEQKRIKEELKDN